MMHTFTPTLAQIEAVLAGNGFEVVEQNESVLQFKEPDTGLTGRAVLEGNILYCTITCLTLPASAVTADLTRRMLDSDNGISTSSFQLYDNNGTVAVALNNFCVLQNMGPEDESDILSCLSFLLADVYEARELLSDVAGRATA
ncbi:MAG: hypothetical protein IPM24_13800 [Bryobacterales bacterium]|jgi:hypothetical protein|nr:hypothetical protein [Bryobacterales bacterium]